MKLLFICNQGQNRSKTAEDMFKGEFETRSAGLYSSSPLSASDLNWADLVFVMEDEQRKVISERFPKEYLSKRIVCLGICDYYYFNQPELKVVLKERFEKALLEIA